MDKNNNKFTPLEENIVTPDDFYTDRAAAYTAEITRGSDQKYYSEYYMMMAVVLLRSSF